ncbi:hypothetical protein C0992_003341 [Termitomyces sp. T32_za158]|nr:hypothetical protein C0992_003341 [Termitomyces sp. T32_za158]
MDTSLRIQNMPEDDLVPAWEACVRNAVRTNVEVEDELSKATTANTDHIKRTFDYEPFLKAFVGRLQVEGLLNPLMGREEDGSKIKGLTGVTKAKR